MTRWEIDAISYELRTRTDGSKLLQTELWRCDNERLLASIDRFEQEQGVKLLALEEQVPMELLLNFMNASKQAFAETVPASLPYATPVIAEVKEYPEIRALREALLAIAFGLAGVMLILFLLALIIAAMLS